MNGDTTNPGTTMRAADALRAGQQYYTDAQVAYLIALAYQTGRIHAAAEDMAEIAGCWEELAQPGPTREERVAARLAEMDRTARIRAAREGRPYRIHEGGPVDWETGAPLHPRTPRNHLTLVRAKAV